MDKLTEHMRQAVGKVTQHEKVRFGLVGIINTVIDFLILNLLVLLFGFPVVVSNIISTSIAMCASFTLNKKAVFGAKGGTKRQIILFFIVTLSGLWIVQTLIMISALHLLRLWIPFDDTFLLNIAKVIGICVGMVWNYIWYSRVVFKGSREKSPS